ncbi:MAG: diheme cytochrome c-553 [Betaproteobacteria bacterium]|nr:MAG: diheme cytochrome c-553 [Betaproteobacteria bacterium]
MAVSLLAGSAIAAEGAAESKDPVKRGAYLVNFGGCNDCHTPKLITSKGPVPDASRLLSGHWAATPTPPLPPSDVIGRQPNQWAAITNSDFTAWAGPWGISYAANLTPDAATGLGGWNADQFVKTIRSGRHLGTGRRLLPPMPSSDIAFLNDPDLKAIFAYLKSIKPIQNQVPAPMPPAK